MGGTLLYALRMAITMVGCVVMLFFTSVKLTLLALACMPVVLLPIGLLGLRVRKLSRAVQDRVADVSSHVDETLHEIRTVQAFAHERLESAHLRRARRGGVRGVGGTHELPRAAHRRGDRARVRRRGTAPLGRRPRCLRRTPFDRRPHGVHLLCRDRGQRDLRARGGRMARSSARRAPPSGCSSCSRRRAAHPRARASRRDARAARRGASPSRT